MSSDRAAPGVSWEELVADTPAMVRAALPMLRWRLDLLWQLRLPVQRLAVAQFDWLLDLPLWQRDGRRFQVTPRQVLAAPDRFGDHLRRVLAAELDFPIHAVAHHDRLVVLDGYHRLARATFEGRREIAAMVLSRADLDGICRSG
ncbi:hypothetical protein Athai_28580 [Actinocatenispora thailandica]|uniref:ParB/Sulfiredoxin domain-containing protein n=1 Tax=Actinocatenispora thailandica TaxID=227318 RepID=A0A7R7DP82_9ACTN|nr:hypothetical protein [Actinocatenispora thailandica]BCJ35355.1 hypothetical protein Athai_28580 [Actinocatenispora thailandica]